MKHITPRKAHDLLSSTPEACLIDVRSSVEFLFVGHPVGAHHIAWSDAPDWEVNADFAEDVRRVTDGDTTRPVLLLCRSGTRSVQAAEALMAAGFSNVYNVEYGFEGELDADNHRNTLNGWRHDGLPWEQT